MQSEKDPHSLDGLLSEEMIQLLQDAGTDRTEMVAALTDVVLKQLRPVDMRLLAQYTIYTTLFAENGYQIPPEDERVN